MYIPIINYHLWLDVYIFYDNRVMETCYAGEKTFEGTNNSLSKLVLLLDLERDLFNVYSWTISTQIIYSWNVFYSMVNNVLLVVIYSYNVFSSAYSCWRTNILRLLIILVYGRMRNLNFPYFYSTWTLIYYYTFSPVVKFK